MFSAWPQANFGLFIDLRRRVWHSFYYQVGRDSSVCTTFCGNMKIHCVSKMHQLWNGIAENYKDQFWWNLAEIFKKLYNKLCFSFHGGLFLSTFRLWNRTPKITRILTLYQANAATTLMPFCKEDKICIENLYECKGYNARQFITEFSDKGWTKNSNNGEVKKVRNSRHVNKAEWRVISVNFGYAI